MEVGTAGTGGSSEGVSSGGTDRHRTLDSARESRPTGVMGEARRGAGAQEGATGMERGRGGQGLSPWLAGADNPLAMMRRMQDDLDRVFHAFGIPRLGPVLAPARELEELLARSPAFTQAAQWSPQIEVFERDDNLVVRADLPGVKREDIDVNVENEVLTIRGERRQEQRDVAGGYRRTERSYGTFFRRIPLPDGVDPEGIEASYEDGVLEVTIPAPGEQERGRRRIQIR